MRMLPFFKPKKGFMVAGGGLETSAGGGGGGGGGAGLSFTDDETAVGTFGSDTLYCRKINIPDSFFTSGQYTIPSSTGYKIKFAIGYVDGSASGGYSDVKYLENRYFTNYGNTIRLISSTITSSEIVPNSGYAYIFYTKNS